MGFDRWDDTRPNGAIGAPVSVIKNQDDTAQ